MNNDTFLDIYEIQRFFDWAETVRRDMEPRSGPVTPRILSSNASKLFSNEILYVNCEDSRLSHICSFLLFILIKRNWSAHA